MRATGPLLQVDRSHSARLCEVLQGGKKHFPVDRAAAAGLLRIAPNAAEVALAGRAFVIAAVRHVVACGTALIADLGSGLPGPDGTNTHEVAVRVDSSAHTVYVDNDPIVLVHGRALLREPSAVIVEADLRQPTSVAARLLSEWIPGSGVGLVMTSVLHHLSDQEDPGAIVEQLCAAMPDGSFLVISHLCGDGLHPKDASAAAAVYAKTSSPLYLRSAEQIRHLFGGTRLLGPGVVEVSSWHPHRARQGDESSGRWHLLGGVAEIRPAA
ncbi:SAM-dependent methyltransferase [Sphaerisporangium album]|uniref:SAM-dependent methyltransferase n=1 Tax=Sphaerisporangium album TaxID=509200 RepID=A0A367ELX5_9ACTN|nr:SAM-dependent methyltransferase [Sphaerisporangium album]RCG19041.1 SAM-dependent methyltransferase [Sphaerisporangium album]